MTAYRTAQGQARIWWDDSIGAYRCSWPFNSTFKELLKSLMPVSDYSYDPDTKIWTITERFLKPVSELVERTFGKPTIITKEQAQAASQPKSVTGSPIDACIVEFFRLLPQEAVQKAYRHAAMLMHPDRGGDMTAMSKLNAAWQRLEKELWQKS